MIHLSGLTVIGLGDKEKPKVATTKVLVEIFKLSSYSFPGKNGLAKRHEKATYKLGFKL